MAVVFVDNVVITIGRGFNTANNLLEVSKMNTLTTSTFSLTEKSFLQRAILGNALFSTVSGLLILLTAVPISQFMGLASPIILTMVGILLLLYMPFLVWLANQSPVPHRLAWIVIELDVLWVVGSLILIFTSLVSLTTGGKWLLAITADVVALFAILQYAGLRHQRKQFSD